MKYLMNEKQKDQRKHKEIVPLMTGKHSNDHHPLVTETKRTGSLTETTPQEIVEKIFRSNNRKPMLLQKKSTIFKIIIVSKQYDEYKIKRFQLYIRDFNNFFKKSGK